MSFRLALRSLPRPASSTSRIGQTVARQQQQQRCASSHAISNPTLANIEKRWEAMPPQEQADLWMALRDRMKVDWTEMTMNEKKAGMSEKSFHLWQRVRKLASRHGQSAECTLAGLGH